MPLSSLNSFRPFCPWDLPSGIFTTQWTHHFHLALVIPDRHDSPPDLGFTQALDLPPRDLVPIWGVDNLYSRVLYEEVHFVFVAIQAQELWDFPLNIVL